MIYIQSANGEKVFNTMKPSFYIHADDPAMTIPAFEISDDPTFASILYYSDPLSKPTEWAKENPVNRTLFYTLPFGIIDEGNTYYVRAIEFFGGPPENISHILTIEIQGAIYPIRLSTGPEEFIVRPKRNGFKTSEIITGCGRISKKIITIDFVPMTKEDRDSLYNEFYLALDPWGNIFGRFSLYDQQNVQTIVYWGECDRNIYGEAVRPRDPKFGITLSNLKPGAIRYDGTVIFTEV